MPNKHQNTIKHQKRKFVWEQATSDIVELLSAAGANTNEIHRALNNRYNMPMSIKTLTRLYKEEIDNGHKIVGQRIAENVLTKAINGDYKCQRLVLTRRYGWNTQIDLNTSSPFQQIIVTPTDQQGNEIIQQEIDRLNKDK